MRKTADTNLVIALSGAVLAIATFYVGRTASARAAGKQEGSLATDVKYIKERVDKIDLQLSDDVKRLEGRIDEQTAQLMNIADTASRAHEAAKSTHKRLDDHLEREHGMRGV